jgi:hypothetical protein
MAKQKRYAPYNIQGGALIGDNEAQSLDTGAISSSSGGVAESATIPAGAKLVRLQANADFWYIFNATAVIPSGDDTSGASIYLPAGERRYIHFNGDVDTLSVIAATTGPLINLVFWD